MAGALITGCSKGNEAAVEARNSQAVSAETEKTSSRILEMLAVKGKVTESGAMTAPCTDNGSDEKTFRARHPWSVHQAPLVELQAGMERLRRELPKDGWEIVKDGTDSSTAKSPQLVAESAGREFALDVRLHKASGVGNAPDLLEVTVESACYRSE